MAELQDDYPIGLDLGTTTSCIGVYRNGGVEIIPNTRGEKTTPSIVTILDEKNILVGEQTLDLLINNYDSSVQEIKRFIGKRYDDEEVQKDIKRINYKIVKDKKDLPKVYIKNKDFGPEEISSYIIKKMVQIAEYYLNKKVRKLVITVPAYFNNSQRNMTKQAAELLGLQVLRVINEPTAAALCYGLDKESKDNSNDKNILVFDLGGGTFDVTLLHLKAEGNGKDFEVVSTSGDTHLGGEDFDNKLVDYFLNNFCKKMNENEDEIRKDKKNMLKLKIISENIKKILSKSEETTICLENFYNKKDIVQRIKRVDFESICQDLFDRLEKPISEALENAKLKNSDINEVVLIGGSSRIYKVKEILKKLFPDSKINDKINPDEAVAYGATLEAAKILIKKDDYVSGYNLFDIVPLSLGTSVINKSKDEKVKAEGPLMNIIIKRGSRIPINAEKVYCTTEDYQKSINIDVYEGDKKYIKYNHFLGNKELKLSKPQKGNVKIIVKYNVDVNGILTVTGAEKDNASNSTSLKIVNDKEINLTEEQIEELKKKNQKYYDKLSETQKQQIDFNNLKKTLKEFQDTIAKTEDEEEKYNILMNYNATLEEFIDLFDKNLGETLFEKCYIYVKQLFESYVKTLEMKDYLEKEDKQNIKDKIKEYLSLFKKQSLGYLNNLVEMLKDIPKDMFYEIIIFLMKIMNENGNECLQNMKQFCKYHSLIFFQQSLYYFDLYIVDEKNLQKAKGGAKLLKECKEQKEISNNKIEYINSDAMAILKLLELPDKLTEYKGCGAGCSDSIRRLIGAKKINLSTMKIPQKDIEKYEIILENYEQILRVTQIQTQREPTEQEAFCIANIIKISYRLGHANYQRYIRLGEECQRIIDKIPKIKEKDWVREFKGLYGEIKIENEKFEEERKKKIEECIKNNKDKFDEIDKYYKMPDKMQFINFILQKYPYKEYEEDKKNENIKFNEYSQDLLNYLSKKYQPDGLEYSQEEKFLHYSIIEYIDSKLNSLYSKIQ